MGQRYYGWRVDRMPASWRMKVSGVTGVRACVLSVILVLTLVLRLSALHSSAPQCTEDSCHPVSDEEPPPQVLIHSPPEGSTIRGHVTVNWEVLYFDIGNGFVEIYMDGESVDTPLPFDPSSGQFMEPELHFGSLFGSSVPVNDGNHSLEAVLFSLNGNEVTRTKVDFAVIQSEVPAPPNYATDGNVQSLRTFLDMSLKKNVEMSEAFQGFIEEWPPPGDCGLMRSVPGFPDVEEYDERPMIVYACPPEVCGGTLNWLKWQPEAVAQCGGSCLWVDQMACWKYADVILLTCYGSPKPGFGKWPHQIWAYFCMESDTRRLMLSPNVFKHINVIANYRLHGDVPRLTWSTDHNKSSHVTTTYTPGNPSMYLQSEVDSYESRTEFAAYLVSNCGRPRDLYAARLIEALGPDLMHSYGRCFRNKEFPTDQAHGSSTLALLRKYRFTIAIENYYSHDYVSERFYQPLLAGSVPVYLGAPNIKEFAPGPNSYIDIRDFASPEDLAEYLVSVAQDRSRYMKFLEWRQGGLSDSFQELMQQSMTRGAVYGEGKHHGHQHQVDLNRFHKVMCQRLKEDTGRTDLRC